jgi:lipopolysaccharide/colanic/teichoic acid biosynthesis glycosyltransferase
MRVDVPKFGLHPTAADDPRVTRIGRWLRRTSLDELPQLINILKGDMSLVGPRPEMPFIVERYNARHRQRLQVTPGLTGLWQLSADRSFLIHENIQYDLYYIRHRNFFMDLAILLHTAEFAMKGM